MAKISIGSAQWGSEYGISNISGIPSSNTVNKIITYANSNNIRMIDTARAYGNAESKIGEYISNDFDIVSKIIVNEENSSKIKNLVNDSLLKLKINSIYGFLIHNPKELLKDTKTWEALKNEKSEGKIKKIGYSVYEPKDLQMLFKKKLIPDIVQLPYNILDRKFESYIDSLKKKKIEIHVRSVFLQGLYFMDANCLPSKLLPLRNPLIKLKKLCKSRSLSMLELCLSFVLKNKNIDYIIVGVESLQQLIQINKVFKNNDNSLKAKWFDLNFSCNENLLNPSNW